MSEKKHFSPNFETDQPDFLVRRSSGDIDVMVSTGQRLKSTALNPDGSEDVRYKHEMRGQRPVEGTDNFYETRFVPEASMLPEAQMKLGEELVGVAPMDDLERRKRAPQGSLLRALGARSIDADGMIQMPIEWRRPESKDQ